MVIGMFIQARCTWDNNSTLIRAINTLLVDWSPFIKLCIYFLILLDKQNPTTKR